MAVEDNTQRMHHRNSNEALGYTSDQNIETSLASNQNNIIHPGVSSKKDSRKILIGSKNTNIEHQQQIIDSIKNKSSSRKDESSNQKNTYYNRNG